MTQRILSIETGSEFCSIALSQDNEIMSRSIGVPQKHSLSILPMIDELLAQAQISLKMLDAIAVGKGPGSFTGVRLGISVAQGLCFGLGLPCVPISSLATLAYAAKKEAENRGINLIMPVMDARMQEVYAGVYQLQANELIATIDDFVQKPSEIKKMITEEAEQAAQQDIIAIGTGWEIYEKELIHSSGFNPVLLLPKATPQACDLVKLAQIAIKQGRVCKPEDCIPAYCRNKVTQ